MVFDTYADMVLLKGKVITVNSDDNIAEAVAIKNGKIIFVGDSQGVESLIGEETRRIDLQGKSVLPGFIDAHTHVEWITNWDHFWLDVHAPPLKSLEDILQKVGDKAHKTPKGEWIVGQGGFENPLPTKKDLDSVAPEHPVVLRSSMHVYVLNSKSLALAGITKETPNPKGGIIDKDPKTGEPTGVLNECFDILPIPPYPYEELKEAIKKTLHKYFIQQGVTTIYDLPGTADSIRIYQDLMKQGTLPLRLRLYITINNRPDKKIVDLNCLLKLGFQTGFGNNYIRLGGVKIFADGSGKTAAIYDPPGQTKLWRGLLKLEPEELNKLVFEAHKAGLQIWIHANGDKSADVALDAFELALKRMPKRDHRHRIEHIGVARTIDEHLERMRRLGIIPVPTAAWIYRGRAVPKGMKVQMWRSLIDKGFLPPGNSDCAGAQPEGMNPLFCIWCMVARKTRTNESYCPEERTTVIEAIRTYTMNAAYAGFEENIKGSIELGKLADLIVLSDNPLICEVDKIKDIQVEMTIIDGQIVYERQKKLTRTSI